MKIPLTLLSAGKARLAKEFTPQGSQAYPLVSKLTSTTYMTDATAQGLRDRLALYQQHAKVGDCCLKGQLTREIKNESRAGLCEKDAPTHTLILDIDDYPISTPISTPCTAQDVKNAAEMIVANLPSSLRSVSYIAHASSSFGRKPNSISLHIEFLLSHGVAPFALKEWLRHLNLSIDAFADKLSLNPAGYTLHWLIDPSVADNSKLIYIATPKFKGVPNPFDNDDERWVLVEKTEAIANVLADVGSATPAAIKAKEQKIIAAQRKAMGLPKGTMKTARMSVVGFDGKVNVQTNPNEMHMQLVSINNDYARFNINHGDSNAYYVRLTNPEIVWNHKGEPPFLFSVANPEYYEQFVAEHAADIQLYRPVEPMVFRDMLSDRHYTALYNPKEDIFEDIDLGRQTCTSLTVAARAHLDDFMADYGSTVPPVIPQYAVTFNPQTSTCFDKDKRFVNRFSAPTLMRDQPSIAEEFQGITYDMDKRGENDISAYVTALAPNANKLIQHVLGNDAECYEHFINWLAYAFQYRSVSNTAWVLSGLPGSGKGLMFNTIIVGLWGTQYTSMKKMTNLEDNFNGGLETQLMVAFDEIHVSSGKNPERLLDDIKHMISEERTTIRAMRQDQRSEEVFYNFFCFSNHRDAMRIEPGDRRFNVAPYQAVPLNRIVSDTYDFVEKIEAELPLLAAFLASFDVNRRAARVCIENDAKAAMRLSAQTAFERLFHAIKFGELDYFIEYVLLYVLPVDAEYSTITKMQAAQRIVKAWYEDAAKGQPTLIDLEEMRSVYSALAPDRSITPLKWGSMVRKNGIEVVRRTTPRGKVNCTETQWFVTEHTDKQDIAQIKHAISAIAARTH